MWMRRSLIAAGILGASSGAYGFGYSPTSGPAVARYALTPAGWPPGLRVRIAVLADLHAGAPLMTAERVAGIVDATNALTPDMVLLLGDYGPVSLLVRAPYRPAEIAPILGRLRAPLGRFCVSGNHDWWEDPEVMARRSREPEWLRQLRIAGIRPLQNAATRLPQGFWIAGIDSQIAYQWNRGADDLPGALAAITDDAPVILMAHEPDIFATMPDRVALTLCGHTHGGQVRILGYSPRVPSRYGNRYAYGLVEEGRRRLIVSGGLGTSKIPVRFGVPPEIVEVTLG
ncbi:metallophosphoesterase [Roseococcus sp. SYP-B2431]|uniref:metallophosphoesterase n=1 Tax=Roseococcus sp. SYP-B2431 TaxID=2496640 RepID=UPI00103FB0CD|nr:metallophosphoesterase [Roseococcus sp. SYP-B2431]TCH96121.1 metallophosphoesterase [Roseococcus sp. SYP-B2431]